MGDPTQPGDPAGTGDAEETTNQNLALGVVFGMLGLVLVLTLDDTRVAGLPFIVLGIVYFSMGIRPAKGKGTESPDGDGDGDDTAPGA
jgi:hypothetical protein